MDTDRALPDSARPGLDGYERKLSETLTAFAPAKVNLSLEISGRRPDGYHEVVSLVAFADIGDSLVFQPCDKPELSLDVEGPRAEALHGENLVLQAGKAFLEQVDGAYGGRFVLTKRLPVAAGVGGGSSDAAAAVRLLWRAHLSRSGAFSETGPHAQLIARLSRLGADIPVCLLARGAWMRGIGEDVSLIDTMPALPAVLVNPGVQLSTRDVFAALDAPELGEARTPSSMPHTFSCIASVIEFLQAHPNDLEAVARRLAPEVNGVLHALNTTPECMLARLSGSGPTCFGVYGSDAAAENAANALRDQHPGWWIMPTRLK